MISCADDGLEQDEEKKLEAFRESWLAWTRRWLECSAFACRLVLTVAVVIVIIMIGKCTGHGCHHLTLVNLVRDQPYPIFCHLILNLPSAKGLHGGSFATDHDKEVAVAIGSLEVRNTTDDELVLQWCGIEDPMDFGQTISNLSALASQDAWDACHHRNVNDIQLSLFGEWALVYQCGSWPWHGDGLAMFTWPSATSFSMLAVAWSGSLLAKGGLLWQTWIGSKIKLAKAWSEGGKTEMIAHVAIFIATAFLPSVMLFPISSMRKVDISSAEILMSAPIPRLFDYVIWEYSLTSLAFMVALCIGGPGLIADYLLSDDQSYDTGQCCGCFAAYGRVAIILLVGLGTIVIALLEGIIQQLFATTLLFRPRLTLDFTSIVWCVHASALLMTMLDSKVFLLKLVGVFLDAGDEVDQSRIVASNTSQILRNITQLRERLPLRDLRHRANEFLEDAQLRIECVESSLRPAHQMCRNPLFAPGITLQTSFEKGAQRMALAFMKEIEEQVEETREWVRAAQEMGNEIFAELRQDTSTASLEVVVGHVDAGSHDQNLLQALESTLQKLNLCSQQLDELDILVKATLQASPQEANHQLPTTINCQRLCDSLEIKDFRHYRMQDPEGHEGAFWGLVDSKGIAQGTGTLKYENENIFYGHFETGAMEEGVLASPAGVTLSTMQSGKWTPAVDVDLVEKYTARASQMLQPIMDSVGHAQVSR